MRIVNYIYYRGGLHSRGQRLIDEIDVDEPVFFFFFLSSSPLVLIRRWENKQTFILALPRCNNNDHDYNFFGGGGGGGGRAWGHGTDYHMGKVTSVSEFNIFPTFAKYTVCACLKQAYSSKPTCVIRSAYSIVVPEKSPSMTTAAKSASF